MARDSWLYSTKSQRRGIQKAAIAAKGQLEASSDETFQYLSQSPTERVAASRIVHWGASKAEGSTVSVVGVSKAAGDDPPPSRQLRDPFTTFYVQGIALEPPLPPERLLNLTEESPFHSACLGAKATDACGRGWSFAPAEGKEADEQLIQSEIPEQLRAAMEDITPDLTFTELLYQAAWEMDAIGWGVWEVVRVDNDGSPGKHGKVAAIYPIPSHTIRASLDPRKWVQIRAGRVRYFKKFGAECTINNETGEVFEWTKGRSKDRQQADEMDEAYVASELILFKTYTPRSLWYGLPKWVSAIATVAELGAIREFNVSWFASGGQVDYHMHFKAAGIEMAMKMKEQVEQQVREFAGRGHTNILTAGDESTEVTVQKLGELLREGHFRFRRGDLVKEILIAHQVPPYRIGWAETGPVHRETEVLTRAGWRRIDEVIIGEDVCAWVPAVPGQRWPLIAPKPGYFEFQKVEATHRRHYDTLISFSRDRKGFEIVVSPDHRMAAYRGTGTTLRWLRAGDLLTAMEDKTSPNNWRIPATAVSHESSGQWTADEAALVGWLASEGALRSRVGAKRITGKHGGGREVSLFQNPGPKSDVILALLDRLMVKYSKTLLPTKGGGVYPGGHPRKPGSGCYIFRLLGESKREWYDRMQGEKRLPSSLFQAPLKARLACLDALILGDGHYGKTGWTYSSADRGLADDIMTLAMLCGFGASVHVRHRYGFDQWEVLGRKARGTTREITAAHDVPYNDDAFCLTVSSGALVYRYRGSSYIAGNSLGGNAAPEMLTAYKVGAVEPIQRVIEDRLRTTLFDPKIGIKTDEFRLKLNELDIANLQEELAEATAGVESGWMTGNQAREKMDLGSVEDKPELDEYFYKGQKLGAPKPAPGAGFGAPDPAGQGNQGGQDGPGDGQQPGGGPDGAGFGGQNADGQSYGQYSEAEKAARSVVVDMLRGYETKLKAALTDNDPVDSEQPPRGKRPRRGTPRTVTIVGPARDDKPGGVLA